MHTKLMDQLDICKEQELVIINLTRQLNIEQSQQDFDTFNHHSFGNSSKDNVYSSKECIYSSKENIYSSKECIYSSKENIAPNNHHRHDSNESQAHPNNHHRHDSNESQAHKNELLQADL